MTQLFLKLTPTNGLTTSHSKSHHFFHGLFPLFLSAESTPVTLLALMGHVTAISLLYQTSLVLVGNAVARQLSRWQCVRLLATRLAGIAMIGFGVKLAVNNR
jgi:threonine/homoserine/homoserine lactone efflux protein